jgi:uncharacterized protein YceK
MLIVSWLLWVNLPVLLWAKDPVIKTYRDRTVYTLKDGVRHVIPDWATFVALGYDVSEIKTLEDAALEAYPLGEPASAIVEEAPVPNPLKGCPCVSKDVYEQSLKQYVHKVQTFCFVENKQSEEFLEQFDHRLMGIQHRVIPEASLNSYNFNDTVTATAEMKGCDLVLNLLTEDDAHATQSTYSKTGYDKYACPEMCMPVPIVELPLSWLLMATNPPSPDHSGQHELFSARALTCSLTYRELWQDHELARHHHNAPKDSEHSHITMGNVLRLMARRRFEECNEQHLWQPGAMLVPRKVHGLILWIGSRTRYGLLRSQAEILRNQSSDPDVRIMGWLASEDQYACKVGSSLCYDVSSSNAYFPLMPSTRMNVASAGWSCAQRRMLRALQHAMLLFDPQFILVADDDTYVNIQMLNPGGRLDKYIRTELVSNNHVLGSLTLGKKVTKKGFYWGGAGYLFGRKTIENLNANVLHGPAAREDNYRDEGKMRYLHVMKQAYEESQKICKSCVTFATPPKMYNEEMIDIVGATANVSARVVEICTNLMSPEHTCYHSDHAMTRCLLYAANGYPIHSDCWGSPIGADKVTVGMCMGTDVCGENQLTCHRFYPHPDNALVAKGQYI